MVFRGSGQQQQQLPVDKAREKREDNDYTKTRL
jgi:hypothetical protein